MKQHVIQYRIVNHQWKASIEYRGGTIDGWGTSCKEARQSVIDEFRHLRELERIWERHEVARSMLRDLSLIQRDNMENKNEKKVTGWDRFVCWLVGHKMTGHRAYPGSVYSIERCERCLTYGKVLTGVDDQTKSEASRTTRYLPKR